MKWLIEVEVTRENTPYLRTRFDRSPITIGAAVDNDVVLSEPHISGCHAVLQISGGGLVFEDTSRNGSYIDGEPIARRAELGLRGRVEVPPFVLHLRLTTDPTTRQTSSITVEPATNEPPDFDTPDTRPIIEPVETPDLPADLHAGDKNVRPDGQAVPVLVVTDGPAALRGIRFDLDSESEMVLGRSEKAELRLADRAVSRRHAAVRREPDGRCRLIDLGSINGVFVNGDQVERALLSDGDEIRLGTVAMTFLAVAASSDSGALSGGTRLGRIAREPVNDNVGVLALSGTIGEALTETLADEVDRSLGDERVRWLIVDAKDLREIDHAGLALMAVGDHLLAARGGGLLIAAAPAGLRARVASSTLCARLADQCTADRQAALKRTGQAGAV